MPFLTEIRCPTNNELLASFYRWSAYHYRLDNGIEFPLHVAYAWCHRCEQFVECESLYSVDEIRSRIAKLDSTRNQWPEIDARNKQRFEQSDRTLPINWTQHALHTTWCAALEWRQNRKTPPRCLECSSFFAITVLPESEPILHPAGQCMVKVCGGTHASVTGLPDQFFYDPEGIRVAQLSYEEYAKHRDRTPA